ncbi:MAG: SirB2 family protein [Bacteroidia bacterium]|nr:SirB2 family protein [Bacteroidia bacterium]MBP6533237.1 SirB2 family protein [Bacteroidia bacterium]
MDSNLLARIHGISVMLFLLTYVIKTILLFTSKDMLANYSKKTKVPEMIISTLFLVTGIWLFVIVGGIKTLYIIKLVFVFLSIPIAIVAFKKQNKGLALLSLVLIVGAYGMAEAGKNKPFIPAKVALSGNATAENSTGAKLYFENCAFCHGADGKKLYRGAKDLTISPFAYDDIVQMVREGSKGKMPGYTVTLSDDEIAAVSKFVQNLKAPMGPQE